MTNCGMDRPGLASSDNQMSQPGGPVQLPWGLLWLDKAAAPAHCWDGLRTPACRAHLLCAGRKRRDVHQLPESCFPGSHSARLSDRAQGFTQRLGLDSWSGLQSTALSDPLSILVPCHFLERVFIFPWGCCLLKTASVFGENCTAANSGDVEGHQAHFLIQFQAKGQCSSGGAWEMGDLACRLGDLS